MSKKIITTVGTSLLTNAKNSGKKIDFSTLEKVLYFFEIKSDFEDDIKDLENDLKKVILSTKPKLSAEIESIVAIIENENEPCSVHLIATDTVLSAIASKFIKTVLEANKTTWNITEVVFVEEEDVIRGLQVHNPQYFEQEGFINLIDRIDAIIDKPSNAILNITGGYKVLIPFLTLYGQLNDIDLHYKYEEHSSLIKIPQLPIGMDWSLVELYAPLLKDVSKIKGKKVQEMEQMGLIKVVDTTINISFLGKLLSSYLEKDLPFSKTVMGYLVEYKILNYYLHHNYSKEKVTYNQVELGYKLSEKEGENWEDIDLWMTDENAQNIVAVEIKPASIKSKAIKKKIKKLCNYLTQLAKPINEFWFFIFLLYYIIAAGV